MKRPALLLAGHALTTSMLTRPGLQIERPWAAARPQRVSLEGGSAVAAVGRHRVHAAVATALMPLGARCFSRTSTWGRRGAAVHRWAE